MATVTAGEAAVATVGVTAAATAKAVVDIKTKTMVDCWLVSTEEEAAERLVSIQANCPNVRWASSHAPTGYRPPADQFPVWLVVRGDRMIFVPADKMGDNVEECFVTMFKVEVHDIVIHDTNRTSLLDKVMEI